MSNLRKINPNFRKKESVIFWMHGINKAIMGVYCVKGDDIKGDTNINLDNVTCCQ